MKPFDPRIWNLFMAGAALVAVPACGTRALDDGEDTDTSAESGSSASSGTVTGTSQSSASASTTGGECNADSDCDYGYCLGGECYDWPCGGYGAQAGDAARQLTETEWKLRCQPYYECWVDSDCGDGFVCVDHWCAPDPDPTAPLGPQCDDGAALPSASIPVPELEQVLDLAYGEDTLAIAGTTLGTDISRVVLRDMNAQTHTVVDLPSAFDPQSVALGDLDGDGTDDLVVLDPTAGLLFVRDGAQQTVATFGVSGLLRVGIADLVSAPGDELYGLRSGDVTLWTGSTPSNLGSVQTLDSLGAANFVDAADADADGRAELLIVRTDGVATVYDPVDAQTFVLEDSYPQDTGLRRLAAAPDDGSGLPLILDTEAWNDATFLRRHAPIPDGFGATDADWPRPFAGTVDDVAVLNLLSPQTLSGAVALGDTVWVRVDIANDPGCWRVLESSPGGDIAGFSVGDADGDGVQGLAFTDGVGVWLGGD